MTEQIKILLVDDDKNLLRMVRVRLSRLFDVTAAKGGEDALRLIDEGLSPDIVLLDIDMPGMDGFETFALMKERPPLEYVPVVFLTSLAKEEDKVKGLALGASDYLTKPFEGNVMTLRVPMYVEAARERRRLREFEKSAPLDEEKFARLTAGLNEREREIARMIAAGKSNAEISEQLSYSNVYVRQIASRVYDKFGVKNRSELKKIFAAGR